MSFFSKWGKPGGVIGIEFGSSYVGFAVNTPKNGAWQVSAHQIDSDQPSHKDFSEMVRQFVSAHDLHDYKCHIVLPANAYQIMLVERPDVPDAELREAVKWRVKDLISSPIDSVVIDVFDLPRDANKAGKEMLYVVIAELSRVRELIDLSKESGLSLESIDIEVLALRNITLLKDAKRTSSVVRIRPNAGEVSIYKDGNLYLSRHFKLNFNGGMLDDLPEDELALEVQRSFDYVERQMGQTPPGILFICGEGIGPEKITQSLQRSLPCPVQFLQISEEIGLTQDETDSGILQLCMAAVGAAHREKAML